MSVSDPARQNEASHASSPGGRVGSRSTSWFCRILGCFPRRADEERAAAAGRPSSPLPSCAPISPPPSSRSPRLRLSRLNFRAMRLLLPPPELDLGRGLAAPTRKLLGRLFGGPGEGRFRGSSTSMKCVREPSPAAGVVPSTAVAAPDWSSDMSQEFCHPVCERPPRVRAGGCPSPRRPPPTPRRPGAALGRRPARARPPASEGAELKKNQRRLSPPAGKVGGGRGPQRGMGRTPPPRRGPGKGRSGKAGVCLEALPHTRVREMTFTCGRPNVPTGVCRGLCRGGSPA